MGSRRLIKTYYVLLDFLLINVGVYIAWWIRFESGLIPLISYQEYTSYYFPGLIISILWVLAAGYIDFYESNIKVKMQRELWQVIQISVIVSILAMALSFLYKGYSYSRLTFFISMGLGSMLILLFHKLSRKIFLRLLFRKGFLVSKSLLLGTGKIARNYLESLKKEPGGEMGLVGAIETGNEEAELSDERIIGALDDLKKILIKEGIEEVILADPDLDKEKILKVIYECRKENVAFKIIPKFYDLLKGELEIETLDGMNILSLSDIAFKDWQRLLKRFTDYILSILLIIFLSPFLLLMAVLIKLTSEGPVLYKQQRVGRNGRCFGMYKFRSMYKHADKLKSLLEEADDAEGPIFKIKDDPRVTPLGSFMRRFSVDELPQLINVLKGDMSLVGPRPPLPSEVERYEHWQLRRIDIIPGITGLWQVSARDELSFEKMVKLDIYYIQKWSIWLDFAILFRTIPVVIRGRGAY